MGNIGWPNYRSKKRPKKGEAVIGNERIILSDGSADPDQISAALIYADAVYIWSKFYIPFGVNYSFMDYDSTGISIEAEGGLGIQTPGLNLEVEL